MKPVNKLETFLSSIEITPSAEMDQRTLRDAFAAMEQTKNQPVAETRSTLRRIVMNRKLHQWSAAAAVMIVAIVAFHFVDKLTPRAFGIEQVIAAYESIRFLHIKESRIDQDEPMEYWIESDDQGRILRARYYLPEYCSPEDGAKLIAWTPEKAELWFKRKNGYLIFQTQKVQQMMKGMMEKSQPQLVMQALLAQQKAGQLTLDVQQPQEKHQAITFTVRYKNQPQKQIYYVDPATDLITHIETYRCENQQDILASTMEFFDYNVPIKDSMFTLKDEVPADVTVVDQLNQLIGIPQGNLTDEQAAVETVRQFFQALIDKDYRKAGLIYSGISEAKAKEHFGKQNVTSILSIGKPTPLPMCGEHSFRVPCELEITQPDGSKTTWKPYGPAVRSGEDEQHPDRWIIHGGI